MHKNIHSHRVSKFEKWNLKVTEKMDGLNVAGSHCGFKKKSYLRERQYYI